MNLACPDCGGSVDWSLDRAGNQPLLITKCRRCDPTGPWHHEPCEIIRKPRGKAGIWPAEKPQSAPLDYSEA